MDHVVFDEQLFAGLQHPERDRIVKHHLYARNGVEEYWIVDPDAASVEVFVLSGGALVPHAWCAPGTQIRSPVFADADLPVDALFR